MRLSYLYILVGLFLATGAFAQNYSRVYEDFGLWNNLSLEYDLSKKWSSSLDMSLRLDENARELRSAFAEITLERDLKKKWDTGIVLRYALKSNAQTVRFSPYVKKYYRIKPFNFKYRLKLDLNYKLFSNDQDPLNEVLRNKFTVAYKRKKHRLGAAFSTEWFHKNDRDIVLPSSIRFKMATTYKINKKIDVDLSYIIQEELHKAKPVRDYIVSWGLTMEL